MLLSSSRLPTASTIMDSWIVVINQISHDHIGRRSIQSWRIGMITWLSKLNGRWVGQWSAAMFPSAAWLWTLIEAVLILEGYDYGDHSGRLLKCHSGSFALRSGTCLSRWNLLAATVISLVSGQITIASFFSASWTWQGKEGWKRDLGNYRER